MSESAKWYVVHTYSGYENAVKTSIEKFVNGRGMEDMILRMEIPVETVKEVNESKTVKAKAEHIVDRSIVALATFARLNSRLVSLAAFSRLLRLDRRGHTF